MLEAVQLVAPQVHLVVEPPPPVAEAQTIADPAGRVVPFRMDPFVRHCLLHGLDAIARTVQHEADIAAFESRFPSPVGTTAL